MASAEPGASAALAASLHERLGWWALLGFLSLGLVLEALHGFKVGLYLDVSNETRRHMWTLAHAHGTLLALVNIAFGICQRTLALDVGLASRCLIAATVLLPGGFLLGGAVIYGGDPGLGIVAVPFGALALFVAVAAMARAVGARR